MKHGMLFLIALLFSTSAPAGDWVTWRSFYTHRAETGQRTQQHTRPPESQVPHDPTFQTSGFTHIRSSLNFGQSADNYHRVQQWGAEVRPYGEWRFPYRPYSVPYPMWGEPYAGLNIGGYPYPPYPPMPLNQGGVGGGVPGTTPPVGPTNPWQPPMGGSGYWPWNSGNPYPSGPGQPYPAPPYADGYYPDYGTQPSLNDSQFFEKPTP